MRGETLPCPFGPSYHGTKPNEFVQLDYIHIGNITAGDNYILLVRDDHRDYFCIFHYHSLAAKQLPMRSLTGVICSVVQEDSCHTDKSIQTLFHKAANQRVTDVTPLELSIFLQVKRCRETIGKRVALLARAIMSEIQLRNNYWPKIVPLFKRAMNNPPSP